jgi:hypothetical protein
MHKEPTVRLTWEGKESIRKVLSLVDQAEQIELQLTPDFNHTLFAHLHPDAPRAAVEETDAEGGVELIQVLADIEGLEAFSALTDVLKNKDARIRVISPPMVIIDLSGAGER